MKCNVKNIHCNKVPFPGSESLLTGLREALVKRRLSLDSYQTAASVGAVFSLPLPRVVNKDDIYILS